MEMAIPRSAPNRNLLDNVYVESARLQVKDMRTSIANLRSTMEESRRIISSIPRTVAPHPSTGKLRHTDAGDDNLHR
jgi:hypothetical protein